MTPVATLLADHPRWSGRAGAWRVSLQRKVQDACPVGASLAFHLWEVPLSFQSTHPPCTLHLPVSRPAA